jgi:mannose-6-phosphate isomerase-like protein (cupin superfamily)
MNMKQEPNHGESNMTGDSPGSRIDGRATSRYLIAHTADIEAVPCPCGMTRRAFTEDPDQIATLHVVDIDGEAVPHYHKKLTEIYYVVQGEGEVELDGVRYPVESGSAILIKPGCRHRALGKLRIVNVPIPAFDPEDEWFD